MYDALGDFLEALADPQNHEMVWDEAKGELHVRRLTRSLRSRRDQVHPEPAHLSPPA
jgi:hypothetical protein